MMNDWAKIRQDFPITKNCAYFLSAAMSPIPTPVFETIVENYRELHLDGDTHWLRDLKRVRKMCRDIAELINTDEENLCFVQNTSTAMSALALSLKETLDTPFNIVAMEDEFPASTIGMEYSGLDMRYVRPVNRRYRFEDILACVDDRTAAVVTSYVQYATGFRQDLKPLGKSLKEKGVLFIVNATQAFPFYPIDIEAMNIDVLTASLHKWGLAGHIGTLFFTTKEFRQRFKPPWIGWLSVDTGESMIHTDKNVPFDLHESAKRYEFGTYNLQTLLAFQKSLDYLESIGFEAIRERILELTDRLIQGLTELRITLVSPVEHQEERSAIVSFSLGDWNEEVIGSLREKKIYVSPRGGYIRAAVNIFTDFHDIDRLLEGLAPFAG